MEHAGHEVLPGLRDQSSQPVSLGAVKTVWSPCTPSTSTGSQMPVWKAGREERQGLQETRVQLSCDNVGKDSGPLDHY